MVNVLFVCLGNICRSPTAEGVFRARVARAGLSERIAADSAGTHAYHIGEPPDERACIAAGRRGIDLGGLQGRQATRADFDRFDYVLAMDKSNLANLRAICPPGHGDRLRLFLDFAPHLGVREVPDPYYGGDDGFEKVLDMIEAAAEGLIADIRRNHLER